MALPSQSPRVSAAPPRFVGGRSRRRRRGKGRRNLAIAVVIIGGALVIWQWPTITGAETQTNTPDLSGEQANSAGASTTPGATPAGPTLIMSRGGETPTEAPAGRTATNPLPEREAVTQANSERAAAEQNVAEFVNNGSADPAPNARDTRPVRSTNATPEPQPRGVNPQPNVNRPAEPASPSGVRDLSRPAAAAIEEAEALIARNQPVAARDTLNQALYRSGSTALDQEVLRMRLAELAETLTFSPRAFPDDEMAETYTVQSGDALSVIPRRAGHAVEARLVQRINRIDNPNRIRVGQSLKLLKGPFHAVVDKSAYRMDIYAEQTDSAGNRLYVRSLPVGLGEFGSTPVGSWVVRREKVENPSWVNPRTGEKFSATDENNPIGEYWIGLQGTDPHTELLDGYGIHGTIEPGSIGTEASMGCVRLLDADIELVYALLVGEKSTVVITD